MHVQYMDGVESFTSVMKPCHLPWGTLQNVPAHAHLLVDLSRSEDESFARRHLSIIQSRAERKRARGGD